MPDRLPFVRSRPSFAHAAAVSLALMALAAAALAMISASALAITDARRFWSLIWPATWTCGTAAAQRSTARRCIPSPTI